MAATPRRIELLDDDAHRAIDPRLLLESLTALRRELDALEPELISRALAAGASWSQIGRALGVSKQAAHRKHRHRIRRHERPGPRKLVVLDQPPAGPTRHPVTVTPYRDGPLLVRGPVRLATPDGSPIVVDRDPIALCRCGKSKLKPFCDGTHKLSGFRAPSTSV
jgi:CDGSH-type Zn-finger protein